MITTIFLGLIINFIFYIFYRLKNAFSYWDQYNVKEYSTLFAFWYYFKMIFFGVDTIIDVIEDLYKICSKERYAAFYIFLKPALVIRDPTLIRTLTVTDIQNFTDHPDFGQSEEGDLYNLKGKRWRETRTKISTAFQFTNIYHIFSSMDEVSQNFVKYFEDLDQDIEVDLKDIFARFTNDLLACIAFRKTVDSMRDRKNEFYKMSRQLISLKSRMLSKFLKPNKDHSIARKFFRETILKAICSLENMPLEEKNLSEDNQGIKPSDLIQLALEAKKASLEDKNQEEKDDLDIPEQIISFFSSGFNPLVTTMVLMAYELAINQPVQNQLREEILETLEDNEDQLSYSIVARMGYLDAVVLETLRKYPSLVTYAHVCTKDYTIQPPDNHEHRHDWINVNQGQTIWIPVYELHHDPNLYQQPELFDPHRFYLGNRLKQMPFTYLPFGVGPRSCIGAIFSLTTLKVMFARLLSKFVIVPGEKSKVPLKVTKKLSGLAVKEDQVWFQFKPIEF